MSKCFYTAGTQGTNTWLYVNKKKSSVLKYMLSYVSKWIVIYIILVNAVFILSKNAWSNWQNS